jgi:hypothetical protein
MLLIRKEIVIFAAKLAFGHIVENKASRNVVLRQVAARSYQFIDDPKIHFHYLESSTISLES